MLALEKNPKRLGNCIWLRISATKDSELERLGGFDPYRFNWGLLRESSLCEAVRLGRLRAQWLNTARGIRNPKCGASNAQPREAGRWQRLDRLRTECGDLLRRLPPQVWHRGSWLWLPGRQVHITRTPNVHNIFMWHSLVGFVLPNLRRWFFYQSLPVAVSRSCLCYQSLSVALPAAINRYLSLLPGAICRYLSLCLLLSIAICRSAWCYLSLRRLVKK